MATTDIDLINRAIIKLDANTINDLTEQTREAEVFAILYESIKLAELSATFWNFNQFFKELNREVASPTDTRWKYQYTKPADLLKVLDAFDQNGNQITYDSRTNRIYTNSERVILKYQRDLDESDFPAWFEDLLVARLANEASEPLSGDPNVIQRTINEYNVKYLRAKRLDSQDTPVGPLFTKRNSRWTRAHGGYGSDIFDREVF